MGHKYWSGPERRHSVGVNIDQGLKGSILWVTNIDQGLKGSILWVANIDQGLKGNLLCVS